MLTNLNALRTSYRSLRRQLCAGSLGSRLRSRLHVNERRITLAPPPQAGYRRMPLLGTIRTRDLFVQALRKIRERYRFLLAGYGFMPDHVHLLMGQVRKGNPSKVLQVLKQKVSRALRYTPSAG